MNLTSNSNNPNPALQPLRELVSRLIEQRWNDFAAAHPNLARAIDRVELVDTAIDALRHDRRFIEAMRQADLDEAKLAAAARLLEQLVRQADRLLSI